MTKQHSKKKDIIHQNKKLTKKNLLQGKRSILPPWAIYALLVLTAIIYTKAVFNDFSNLDDDIYLFRNPFLMNLNLQGLISIFTSFYFGIYHPLTTLTFLFEYHIYGFNPLPYHLFNVVLHLVNVYLVYKLTEQLSGKVFTALFVSALFALHPMHVESVAWIVGRKDVLYTLFYLASMIVYVQYLNKKDHKAGKFILCILLFLCSLLSKPSAITLPVLLIAIDLYRSRKPDLNMFLEKIPFFLLALVFGLLPFFQEKTAMAEDTIPVHAFYDRIFVVTYNIAFYIVKFLAPFHLSAMHYYPENNGGALPWYYYASLPFVLLVIWLIIRKSPLRREKIFGASFFLIVISIMLQITYIGYAVTSERYTYVSYIGLFYIAGQWISNLQKTALKKWAFLICGLFIIVFSYLTWERIGVWKNGIVLFNDIVEKNPDSYRAYGGRAYAKSNYNDFQGALRDYNKTLEINPRYALGLTNRATILIERFNDYNAAFRDLNLSIQLDSTIAESFLMRGLAYKFLNDTAAAMQDYNKAIQINPKLQKAYNNRGALKIDMNNPQGALEDILIAIELNPGDGDAYKNRAAIKYMTNDFPGCMDDCNTALKINPEDGWAFNTRGYAKLNLHDTTGACSDWNRAVNYGFANSANAIQQYCK